MGSNQYFLLSVYLVGRITLPLIVSNMENKSEGKHKILSCQQNRNRREILQWEPCFNDNCIREDFPHIGKIFSHFLLSLQGRIGNHKFMLIFQLLSVMCHCSVYCFTACCSYVTILARFTEPAFVSMYICSAGCRVHHNKAGGVLHIVR